MADPTTPSSFDDLKASVQALLPQIQEMALVQAQEAIKNLALASEQVGKQGVQVLQQLTMVMALMAEGKISKETADLAVGNYLEALKLLGAATVNAAGTEAYERGKAMLATLKTVLLAVLEIALKVGLAQAGAFMGGIKFV